MSESDNIGILCIEILLSLPAAGHEKSTLDFSKMLLHSSILRLFGFSTFLHVNCFLIEKKLLYPNVKDSIIILPWIDPISDHNDFSK